FGMHPSVSAMIVAIERERHAEELFLRLFRCLERMALDQFGVRLAFPAIECVRALAALEFAREHVPADAIARRQLVKIRMPADLFHAMVEYRPSRSARGCQQGRHYRHQHEVKRAEKNNMSEIPVKSIIPRQHD